MNLKSLFVITLLFVMLGLAACGSTAVNEPAVETPVVEVPVVDEPAVDALSDAEADEEKISVPDNCPEAVPGAHLLIDAANGICFLYPDQFDVAEISNGSFTMYVDSLLNTEAPMSSFDFEPADGRSLEEVTAQRLADFALPDTEAQAIDLGGEPANMLENLPGQDINHRVVAVHNDIVYDVTVTRVGALDDADGERAETLFPMIIDSLQFIDIEPEAALMAGPECPEASADTILFTNDRDGFCLLLPAEYEVEISDGQTAVYVESIQSVTHPRLFVNVEEANGRTLQQITTAKLEKVASAMPDFEVDFSFGYMLDGVPANQFNKMPGQEFNRQVVLVHNGRFYTLTFVPDDPGAGDVYAEMQTLYDMVMDSFSFLWHFK